jgi:hypothetical protein
MKMEKEDRFENGIPTSSLLNRLFKSSDLNDFLKENEKEMVIPTFMEHLDRLCRERNVIREHVINRSGIERCFGHQLFRGTRKPSRDNVLRLAFGFGLNVEETQELLRSAKKAPLYPRIKRDAAIIFGLSHQQTIMEIQSVLNDLELSLLGEEKYEHTER